MFTECFIRESRHEHLLALPPPPDLWGFAWSPVGCICAEDMDVQNTVLLIHGGGGVCTATSFICSDSADDQAVVQRQEVEPLCFQQLSQVSVLGRCKA